MCTCNLATQPNLTALLGYSFTKYKRRNNTKRVFSSSIKSNLKKAQMTTYWKSIKRQFVHFAPFNAAVTPFGSKKWLFSGWHTPNPLGLGPINDRTRK